MKKIISVFIFTIFFVLNVNAYDCGCQVYGETNMYYDWYAETEAECCDPWTGMGWYEEYIGEFNIGSGYASSEDIMAACC